MSVILSFIDRPIELSLSHVGLPGPAGTGGNGTSNITSIDIDTPTTLTGLLKGVSSHVAAATAGVDYAAASHTQAASTISDSTAAGRAILTAATAAAQRTALALGNAAVANIGTLAGNVCAGDDARLSDTRTPSAHVHDAANITTGTLDGDRLPGLSTTKVGGAPATGTPTSTKFLRDDGTWSVPAGSGSGISQIDLTTPTTLTGILKGNGSNVVLAAGGTDYANAAHTHVVANISDSTAAGRSMVTAVDAAAQRTMLTLGNAALANIGTLSGNVAAGDHSHAHSALTSIQGGTTGEYYHLTSAQNTSVSSVTAAGWALIDDAAAVNQRTTLGLGNAAVANIGTLSGNVCSGDDSRLSDARTPTAHTHPASNISDSTAAGRSIITAADAAAQRTLLTLGNAAVANIGTLSGNVAAGDHSHAHSALTSLQGGTTGEYYHITSAQNTSLGTVTAAGWALIDDAAATNQRTTLGLGNAAVANIGTLAGNVAAGDDSRFSYVRYDTIWCGAGGMRPKTTGGPSADGYDPNTTPNVSLDILNFDSTTPEFAYFSMIPDENWDLGTLKAKFPWTTLSTNTTNVNVNWYIAAAACGDNTNLSNIVMTNYVNVVDATQGANFVNLTAASPALTVGGTPALGKPVFFVIKRDIGTMANNVPADAGLHGVWIQYHTLTTLASGW